MIQQYFSALGTVFPKSSKGAFSSNSRLDVREICKIVIEIFWDEVFMFRNTVKNGQSWSLAVIRRKTSAFHMQFHLMVSYIFLKMCVNDRGDRSTESIAWNKDFIIVSRSLDTY